MVGDEGLVLEVGSTPSDSYIHGDSEYGIVTPSKHESTHSTLVPDGGG